MAPFPAGMAPTARPSAALKLIRPKFFRVEKRSCSSSNSPAVCQNPKTPGENPLISSVTYTERTAPCAQPRAQPAPGVCPFPSSGGCGDGRGAQNPHGIAPPVGTRSDFKSRKPPCCGLPTPWAACRDFIWDIAAGAPCRGSGIVLGLLKSGKTQ